MFKKILVCTDGSKPSMAAVRAGAAIARHYGAEIAALNVFHHSYAGPTESGAWAIAIDDDVIDRCARAEREAIEESVCPIFAGLDTAHGVIQAIGHPVEVILATAKREKVDLIVIGSRGLRGLKEVLLGSVSSSVMHHAPCPVLIVHGDPEPGGRVFEEILLASDGSESAQKATIVAVEMAQKFATSLTVLNVCEGLSSLGRADEEEALIGDVTANLYAKQMIETVRQNVSEVAKEVGVYCYYVQKIGYPDEVIVEFAAQHHADLIVVGSRGLGGFAQMLIGSISNHVAHHASWSVLVVH